MNISDILLEFRKTQNITLLECTNMNISNEDLNVISIEILSWLKTGVQTHFMGKRRKTYFSETAPPYIYLFMV